MSKSSNFKSFNAMIQLVINGNIDIELLLAEILKPKIE